MRSAEKEPPEELDADELGDEHLDEVSGGTGTWDPRGEFDDGGMLRGSRDH